MMDQLMVNQAQKKTQSLIASFSGILQKKQLPQRPAVRDDSTSASPIVHDVLRSPGAPLDAETRAFMEPRFGHDFSRVRLHTDARAARSARAVEALAYTVGDDIVFAEGKYRSNIAEGQRLLAHELTRVVKQSKGDSGEKLQSNLTIKSQGDVFEQESNVAAGRIMNSMHAMERLSSSGLAIQRDTPGDDVRKEDPEKKEDESDLDAIFEGLKIFAKEMKDNNPRMKKLIGSTLGSRIWSPLSTGQKAAAISLGAASLGVGAGVDAV